MRPVTHGALSCALRPWPLLPSCKQEHKLWFIQKWVWPNGRNIWVFFSKRGLRLKKKAYTKHIEEINTNICQRKLDSEGKAAQRGAGSLKKRCAFATFYSLSLPRCWGQLPVWPCPEDLSLPWLADARHAVLGTGKPGVAETKTLWLFTGIAKCHIQVQMTRQLQQGGSPSHRQWWRQVPHLLLKDVCMPMIFCGKREEPHVSQQKIDSDTYLNWVAGHVKDPLVTAAMAKSLHPSSPRLSLGENRN